MRPILLKGHERAITFLKYNREGDLIFTCSKDKTPCVWRADSGERLGTYDGHTGTIWSCDVTPDTKLLLTASADQTCKLWDVQTGRELYTFPHSGTVRCVAWAEGGHDAFATASDCFGTSVPASINVYAFAERREDQTDKPRLVIVNEENPTRQATTLTWLPLNAGLVATYEEGSVAIISPESGETLSEWRAHDLKITSLSFNAEKTLAITSSSDRTAKLWEVSTDTATPWRCLRTYTADTPLNGAAICPRSDREHVIIGGGQEAMNVTTTSAASGRFETRFVHMIFGTELGRVRGHFGPINTLAFAPDGRSFASGAEDGFARLHHLDGEYDALGEADDRDLDDPVLGERIADGTLERLEKEELEAQRKAKEVEEAMLAATAGAVGSATGGAGAASRA